MAVNVAAVSKIDDTLIRVNLRLQSLSLFFIFSSLDDNAMNEIFVSGEREKHELITIITILKILFHMLLILCISLSFFIFFPSFISVSK